MGDHSDGPLPSTKIVDPSLGQSRSFEAIEYKPREVPPWCPVLDPQLLPIANANFRGFRLFGSLGPKRILVGMIGIDVS